MSWLYIKFSERYLFSFWYVQTEGDTIVTSLIYCTADARKVGPTHYHYHLRAVIDFRHTPRRCHSQVHPDIVPIRHPQRGGKMEATRKKQTVHREWWVENTQ